MSPTKGIKKSEIKKCGFCGKGVGHNNSLNFLRVRVERCIILAQGVQIRLRVWPDYRHDGQFIAAVEFNLNGHKLELSLSEEQTRGVVEACASAIVKASAEAAEGMSSSVNQAMNLIESTPEQKEE